MSSLWTPGGEHRVERPSEREDRGEPAHRPPSGSVPPPRAGAPGGSEGPTEEELDEIRSQLLEAPVEVVIGNHAYGIFELAALHLSASPPNLEQARLAVDALGALVEGLQGRLGNVGQPLTEALAQIRLAYVQISSADAPDPGGTPGESARS